MHEDGVAAIETRDRALADEVTREDRDVDRLHWLVARQSNMVIRDGNLARKMGIDPGEASSYASVSRILERIGDHAVRIAKNAAEIAEHQLEPEVISRLRQASAFSLEILDRALTSFFTRDMPLANETIEEVRRAEFFSEQVHTMALSLPAGPAVALGYVAESIRRSGEYSGDIAETAINHAIVRES
jgi:phosphate uptake regulator